MDKGAFPLNLFSDRVQPTYFDIKAVSHIPTLSKRLNMDKGAFLWNLSGRTRFIKLDIMVISHIKALKNHTSVAAYINLVLQAIYKSSMWHHTIQCPVFCSTNLVYQYVATTAVAISINISVMYKWFSLFLSTKNKFMVAAPTGMNNCVGGGGGELWGIVHEFPSNFALWGFVGMFQILACLNYDFLRYGHQVNNQEKCILI